MATYKITKPEEEMFNFQVPGSKKVYSVPLLTKLPISQLKKVKQFYAGLNDEDTDVFELIDILSELFEPYAPGVVDSLSIEQSAFLLKAYQEASQEGTSISPLGE